MKINIGQTKAGKMMSLPLARANRHGLITGSTGTGKTRTLQTMAEQFSAAGVPVFCADIKGDLSGLAAYGDGIAIASRLATMGRDFTPARYPTAFWDLFGVQGLPMKTSVQTIGAELLGRMLKLNEVQQGTLAICFKKAEDDAEFMLTLDDLRWALGDMLDERETICGKYGNITASSINSIQRNLLALESQGGFNLFGEPPFDVMDLIRTDEAGNGIINLLAADRLVEAPKLYAVYLLWLLTELFRALPEVGDIDKPKLGFFFDEAHLLFTDAPKELVQSIERLVRLVRSKGVGVFFVTQSPADIPDAVLAQLGSRIQHALRAYTPKDQRMVKAAALAFRENRGVDVKTAITTMAVGEALVSVLDEDGVPTKVEIVSIVPPSSQIGGISALEQEVMTSRSDLFQKYSATYSEAEASQRFDTRIRAKRGMPARETMGEWKEGDYAQFLPDFAPAVAATPSKGRMYHAKRLAFWCAMFAASFSGLAMLVRTS